MGMLKRMKDMKDMANAAPGMVQQAQHLGAQAQMAAAHQAAAQAQLTRVQGRWDSWAEPRSACRYRVLTSSPSPLRPAWRTGPPFAGLS